MFGDRIREKQAGLIEAGDYILLGGITLLYVSAITEAGGLLRLATEIGGLLFAPTDMLRVV